MDWSAAEAKAKLSEVLEEAQKEPQKIRNRGKPVAFVISIQEYEALRESAEAHRQRNVGGVPRLLAELDSLKARAGGGLDLKMPGRASPAKKLPFAEE